MKEASSYGVTGATGAAYLGFAQAVQALATIVSTVIVARLLTPSDYGVVAMVAPVMAFLMLFRNMGLSQAAVQARTLSDEQSNALFWINMAAAAIITVVLLVLAPVVAWFYEDVRAGYLTAASAATVLIGGAAIQHMALINREMRFRRLGAIEIASSVMTLVATVAAAWVLRSYWALWLGAFIATLMTNVLIWRSSRWRPSRKITFKGTGKMIRFGGALTGFNLLNFLSRNLDNILIGKVWGPSALGLYDRSYRLMMFPLQNVNAPLGRVVFPLLSRLQDEPERFRRSFLMIARAIMLLTVPGIAAAGATSDRLIPLLLGPQWVDAAPIFFWLSLAALTQPISSATGWLFTATGRGRDLLRWGSFATVVLVGAFLVGVQFGATGVAAAYFAANIILVPFLFPASSSGTAVRTTDLYRACFPPFVAAALSWAAIRSVADLLPLLPLLSLSLVASYALSVLVHWADPAARKDLWEMGIIGKSSLRRAFQVRGMRFTRLK